LSADCQQITSGEQTSTLSADRFGWLQAVPDQVGFVIRGGSRVVVGRLQQLAWTARMAARSTVEVVAEELGPSLRWATAMPVRVIKSGGA
jgi:single-strand DNA-binding protein